MNVAVDQLAAGTSNGSGLRGQGSIQWVAPAPLWAGDARPGTATFRQPSLVKFTSDNFLPEFLDAMEGRAEGIRPADFLAAEEHRFDAAEDRVSGTLKLYHPAHGRFALATGSLVCRQLGLPDRAVSRKDGERVSFVIRREVVVDGKAQEQGWVDDGPARGWQPLIDENSNATSIRSDEERLPAHPVKALLQGAAVGSPAGGKAGAASGIAPSATDAAIASLAGATRTLFYGYVPVGNREKYVDRRPVAAAGPAQVLADYQASVQAASTVEADFDFRLDEVTTRVVNVWHGLFATDATAADKLTDTGGTERAPTVALYLILDLADWLNRYIPEVFTAIINGQPAPAGTRQALVDELEAVKIQWQENGTGAFKDISLADAIKEIAPDLDLVRGSGDEPNDKYDIRFPVVPGGNAETYLRAELPEGAFHQKLRQALSATGSPADVSEEIVSLLKDQVTLEPPDGAATAEGTYFLRFVYEYPPCKPVLSERSEPFTFARYFDPDAPARHIRIQLPSVNMKDLRKYKRGVGLEMSPELRDIMNRVNKKMLDGGGLSGSAGGWELGMICSFSLQIIFLVAFIVMFIFLIAFNFIFWWLPFLKICFPIPVKKSA